MYKECSQKNSRPYFIACQAKTYHSSIKTDDILQPNQSMKVLFVDIFSYKIITLHTILLTKKSEHQIMTNVARRMEDPPILF